MDSQDQLQSSIVPKIEKEFPSTLELDQHMLPAIKNWKVGQRYMVKLSIENVESEYGSLDDPNNKTQYRSKFRVLGAQEISYDNAGKSVIKPMAKAIAQPVDNSKNMGKSGMAGAFMRIVAALMDK